MSSPNPLKLDSKPVANRKQQNNNRRRFNKHDRSCRKRSKSFTGGGPINPKPVLPTKFLLGGNINDPLNLNSLQDEEINRAMNAVTPKSSPLPTPPRRKMPIEVIVSPNTHDPLHLTDLKDDKEYEEYLSSPIKKGRKKRLKKRRTMSASVEGSVPDFSGNSEAKTPEASTDSAKVPEEPREHLYTPSEVSCKSSEIISDDLDKGSANLTLDIGKDKKQKRKSEEGAANSTSKKFKYALDKIVSPVVPQPNAWLKRSNSIKFTNARPRQNKVSDEKLPAFKDKNKRFQYGNYNRYYGYRNPNNETDYRLKVFSYHPYLFENKDILDIGCNIGHITLSVARDFSARSVTGIDIDPKLIFIARKNVKHYVKTAETLSPSVDKNPDSNSEFFPISLPILYGPLDIPGFHEAQQGTSFPKNVSFKQCNYVPEDESLLSLEQPQFDVILCLSTTKWIHLNWGDNGLKLAFRRMYEQLRPGGKLILEPQHWAGYKSKKKLTENIYKNYNAIEFFPDKFRDYLLSPAVGFAKTEILGFPQYKTFGFRRPIQVFTKSTMFPSERVEVTPGNPVYNDSVYQEIMRTGKYESQSDNGNCTEHVYTNLLQPTPMYSRDSEENLDINESPSQCLSDDNRIVPVTLSQSCDSKLMNSSPEHLSDVTSDCSCDVKLRLEEGNFNEAASEFCCAAVKIGEERPQTN